MATKNLTECVILIDSVDKKGLITTATSLFLDYELNIDKNDEFIDVHNHTFFMRIEVSGANLDKKKLLNSLKESFPKNSNIQIINKHQKKKIIIFTTKETHALGDILLRTYENDLNIEILAVISNRENTKDLVDRFDIPYIYINADDIDRSTHEKLVLEALSSFTFDYIVLAKYMRILSDNFTDKFTNKIINIHHSFLPAFIGANPYLKAYERGVKMIGATAHFVTKDLDDGPIIVQDVFNINHSHSLEEMKKSGKTIEKNTITKALKLVCENKVFVSNNKTIIFE